MMLGIIYNNGLQLRPLSEIRFGSVLGRIGLAYMFANIHIYLYTKQVGQNYLVYYSAYWFIGSF